MKNSSVTTPPANQKPWLTILRALVGIVLLWRGIFFVRELSDLEQLIRRTGIEVFSSNAETLAMIVAMLNLLCGFFILVGLFTRIAAIVLIPILLVAVLFVNIPEAGEQTFELILSVVILLLLLIFAFKGAGPLSADEYFRRGSEQDRRADRF